MGFLEGKRALIVGVASPRSIAWGIAEAMHEQGAELVIAGGMGRRAQQLFAQHGVDVVTGAPPEPPETVVAAYLDGTLEVGANACDH